MLQLNFIKENRSLVLEGLEKRNFGPSGPVLVDELIQLDEDRRSTKKNMDDRLAEVNKLSEEIGALFKSGKGADAGDLKARVAEIKAGSQEFQNKLNALEEEVEERLLA